MIISHRHRFIYLKTIKTASSSVEAALSQLCGPDDVITPAVTEVMAVRTGRPAQNYRLDHPLVPKRPLWRRLLRRPERSYHPSVGYYEHMPAWRVMQYVGPEIWQTYFTFTFERNPWDRQVSYYHFKQRNKDTPISFETFLKKKRSSFVPNFEIYTVDGKPCVDFVGSYERIEDDFDLALESIGLKGAVRLPSLNVSRGRSRCYKPYYDDGTRALIGAWYEPEISTFGYEF